MRTLRPLARPAQAPTPPLPPQKSMSAPESEPELDALVASMSSSAAPPKQMSTESEPELDALVASMSSAAPSSVGSMGDILDAELSQLVGSMGEASPAQRDHPALQP